LLDIARKGNAAFDSSEVVENIAEEQQEAALNPIDITLQDLQKWRDTHEKRVAEMRMEAAIEAEEAQQASAVAVPGFEWTGLTGVDAAPAPDGLVAVTVEARGPLGVEVEWAVPPRFVVVTPGSIAHRAGLRAGDELAQIDQADVRDWPGDRIAPLLGLRPLNPA
jgi:membrane-associated protease RseP (regulator of RpoE activity)